MVSIGLLLRYGIRCSMTWPPIWCSICKKAVINETMEDHIKLKFGVEQPSKFYVFARCTQKPYAFVVFRGMWFINVAFLISMWYACSIDQGLFLRVYTVRRCPQPKGGGGI